MRTESILTMKTASGNKQETVVLLTRRKNKLLTTHMLRWSKVNHFQKSAKED